MLNHNTNNTVFIHIQLFNLTIQQHNSQSRPTQFTNNSYLKTIQREETAPVHFARPHTVTSNVYADCPRGIVRPEQRRGFTQLVIYVINYKLKSGREPEANLQVPQIAQTTSLTRRQPVT